jgi:hypothetical protein
MCERSEDIEALARIAARLAGRDPDEHLTLKLADLVPFDGAMWSYPDFLMRAEAAYHALEAPVLTLPPSFNGTTAGSVRHRQDTVAEQHSP